MVNLQLNWLSQKMLQQVRENDNNSRKKNKQKGNSITEGIMQSYQAYQTASAVKIWRIPLLTSRLDVDTRNIDGCSRLPLSRNRRGHDKRVIVKFFNRKNADTMLKHKKRISAKNFGHLNVTNNVFLSVSLCPYYRYTWGKCEDLQRKVFVQAAFSV